MSSDEDDYMSDKFLKGSDKEDIRPGVPKRKADTRIHELYKKKLKTVQPKREERERDLREAGLNTAISDKNKGFQMLAKMGYKPGTSLGKTNTGIVEPINIVVRSKNSGIGTSKKKRKPAESQDLQKLEGDFRKALHEKKQSRLLRKYFAKAQTSCEYLDKTEDIQEPLEDFFWPKEVMDKLRNKSKDKNEDDEEVEEESSDSDDYEDVITKENLDKMTDYLLNKYFYCVYCAAKGVSKEDLDSFCPGPTLDDHSLD